MQMRYNIVESLCICFMFQIYTSHGPTVIMPTWFCKREIFDTVGGFDEGGKVSGYKQQTN